MRRAQRVRWLILPALLLSSACDDSSGGDSGEGTTSTGSEGTDTSGTAPTSGSTASAETTANPDPSTSTTADPTSATGTTTVDPTTVGTSSTGDAETSGSGSTGGMAEPPPPTDGAALLPWLEAGNYADWAAEPAAHPSAGPHFTAVRTFVNASLLASMEAANTEHPVGAAVVKELYGDSPNIGGWAVMVKVAPGDTVDTWYWYESFEGTTYADDTGVNGCGNCHSSGVDYIRTELPL